MLAQIETGYVETTLRRDLRRLEHPDVPCRGGASEQGAGATPPADRRSLAAIGWSTDVEVLQEILHRYAAIGRLDAIQPAFDALLGVVDEVFPIDAADVDLAKDVLLGGMSFTARDALHIAVLERHGVNRVMSFDADFDRRPGLTRLS